MPYGSEIKKKSNFLLDVVVKIEEKIRNNLDCLECITHS